MSPKNVVFKKISKDKSVGVYMGRRDFVDRVDSVDPVDGVLLVDPEQLKGKKAYVTLSCVFRYGRDDMDVMGIAFRREIYMSTRQIYPPLQDKEQGILTRIQDKLLRKLGDNAYPFFFEHCAVEFEVKAFCAESQDTKARKRSSVRLMIRKVQYAPAKPGPAPCVETTRDFLMSDKPLHLEAQLEKQASPPMPSLSFLEQIANVVLYCNDSYMKPVALEDSGDSVDPGAKLDKVYTLLPLLANNRERRGIALDGKLKHEDTNLASSSIIKEGVLKEVLGILVTYRIVVKLVVGGMMGSSEVGVELPFQLMHPKPETVRESELEDEMVFEEFKRTYLKGMTEDDDDGNISPGEH
ncbi:hypothetical protein DNTS_032475 [Danionella cerebrum]|uniref:S-arrestin n=1 Tax=Danionella cerebrum TaxID=2873325 RepID=A0A553QZR6_9TELE|nr:hypothetical protein DNTS_032475 [Danionella translucida]